MLFYTLGQQFVFLASVLAGLAVGALYDAFRLARALMEAGRALSAAADAAFGLAAGLVVFACAYIACYGEVRLYFLLGVGAGAAIYFFTVTPAILALVNFLKVAYNKRKR